MVIERIRRTGKPGFLDGQMLIATPAMPDERFSRSVIYICAHSAEGAMGIVVNRRARQIAFPDLLVQLDVIPEEQAIRLPKRASRISVLAGGPVETTRGFVLHSTDYMIEDSSLPIAANLGLTITIDMLRAIARGEGPENAVLALGYASWGAGQLEAELQTNSWLHGPFVSELLFSDEHEQKYEKALRSMGIEPAFLSMEAGHA
jgi:putative transcriptional regulator